MTENPDRQAAPVTPAPIPAQVRRSRLGGLWVVLVLGAVVLVLLLVFILMNGQRVQIHLYGADLTAPLGVALLLAAALGVLLVVVPGAGRIIQLKRAARRLHREREHLAGRLDEVTHTTGVPAGDTAAPASDAPSPGQPQYGQQPEQPQYGQQYPPSTQQPPRS